MSGQRNEVADLESQVAAFDREAANAAADIESLQSKRPSVLLNGTDDDLKAHDEAFGVAQRARERALAKKADAEQRLATAKDQAAQAEAAALKVEADVAADDAAAVIKKAFADIRKVVAKAREKLETAEQKVWAANHRVDDDHALASVEGRVYAGSDLPMKIIREEPTNRWLFERSGVAVPKEKLPKIVIDKDDAFRGQIRWEAHDLREHGCDVVVCRKFMRREFLPRVQGQYPRDLGEALRQIEDLTALQELQDDRTPQVEWSRLPDDHKNKTANTKMYAA